MKKRQRRDWIAWLGWPRDKRDQSERRGNSLPDYTEYRLSEKQFSLAELSEGHRIYGCLLILSVGYCVIDLLSCRTSCTKAAQKLTSNQAERAAQDTV